MSLREEALRRILSLDSGRAAQLSLQLAAEFVQARSGAVLALEGDRYELLTAQRLDQRDLTRIASTWEQTSGTLLARHAIVCKDWTMIPIGTPVSGLAYLGDPKTPFSRAFVHHIREELEQLLELAISLRKSEPEMRALHEIAVQTLPMRFLEREKLVLIMRACGWNKTKAAEYLHVTRATIYNWLRKHRIRETA